MRAVHLRKRSALNKCQRQKSTGKMAKQFSRIAINMDSPRHTEKGLTRAAGDLRNLSRCRPRSLISGNRRGEAPGSLLRLHSFVVELDHVARDVLQAVFDREVTRMQSMHLGVG